MSSESLMWASARMMRQSTVNCSCHYVKAICEGYLKAFALSLEPYCCWCIHVDDLHCTRSPVLISMLGCVPLASTISTAENVQNGCFKHVFKCEKARLCDLVGARCLKTDIGGRVAPWIGTKSLIIKARWPRRSPFHALSRSVNSLWVHSR